MMVQYCCGSGSTNKPCSKFFLLSMEASEDVKMIADFGIHNITRVAEF